MNLFTDYAKQQEQEAAEKLQLQCEKQLQETIIKIQRKYGKNSVLKGMNLKDGATTIERNKRIGGRGHKA